MNASRALFHALLEDSEVILVVILAGCHQEASGAATKYQCMLNVQFIQSNKMIELNPVRYGHLESLSEELLHSL